MNVKVARRLEQGQCIPTEAPFAAWSEIGSFNALPAYRVDLHHSEAELFFFLLPFPAEAKSREIGEISKSRQRELLLSGNGEGERGPEKKK